MFNSEYMILYKYILPFSQACITIIAGWLIAKTIRYFFRKIAYKTDWDDTAILFIGNFIYYVFLIGGIALALTQVSTFSNALAAVLGASVLAIGLSLKNHLANLASGILLVIARPYSIGDYIEADGQLGQIKAIRIFFTLLQNIDNHYITIPNAKLTSNTMVNLSKNKAKKISYLITIKNTSPPEVAKNKLLNAVNTLPSILKTPSSHIVISGITSETYQLNLIIWAKPELVLLNKVDAIEAMINVREIDFVEIKKQ